MYLFRPQCYEIRYQLQEKMCKKYKYMEAKIHTTNNQDITEGIKEEIKKYVAINDNENTTTQDLWDAARAVLRWKFITIQAYHKKKETYQTT